MLGRLLVKKLVGRKCKANVYVRPPSCPPQPRQILLGPTGSRRSDMGYLSDEEREWLNDTMLKNACLILLKVPKLSKGKIHMKDPIGVTCLVDTGKWGFMQKRSVMKVLDGRTPNDFVTVQFSESLHWRFLVLFGPERKAIYWDPYGTGLPACHSLHTRLEGFGWSVHSVRLALQPTTDNYQCAIWVHVILQLFLRYAAAAPHVSACNFEAAIVQQEEFRPIPPSGGKRSAAIATNVSHASTVRKEMRAALWNAAVAQRLPHGLNAQLEHLGARPGEEIDVDPDFVE